MTLVCPNNPERKTNLQRMLIISFSEIAKDPRVSREIRLFRDRFDLIVAGHGTLDYAVARMVSLPFGRTMGEKAVAAGELLLGAFLRHYWRQKAPRTLLGALAGERFDVVLANDIEALPVALEIAQGAPVVLDAHEYSPKEFDGWKWRLFFSRYKSWLCRRYLPQATRMCTVAEGIARAYESEFGVRGTVVMNAAPFEDISPTQPDGDAIRLIHHGGINRSRRIEGMIDMMRDLDARFTLDLMLVKSDPDYYRELVQRAANNPRISFIDPVPLADIPRTINRYDLGVYLLPPTSFNNQHALPNKFFEFIQGRLGVAIGPSPEMAALVNEYGLGIVASDFSPQTLARALNRLTCEEVRRFKESSHRAARPLSAEVAGERLMGLVEQALHNTHPRESHQ